MTSCQIEPSHQSIGLGHQGAMGKIQQFEPRGQLLVAEKQWIGRDEWRGARGVPIGHVDTHDSQCYAHSLSMRMRERQRPMSLIPYDDRDGLIWMDGAMVPWRDAKLHVLSHALHYASAVFEGERVYGGGVFKLSEHSQRLVDSAAVLGFELPYDVTAIDQATKQVVAANRIIDGYVRPVAWRGAEMMGVSAQKCRIHVAIAAWTWPVYFTPEARLKGIRMTRGIYHRPSPKTAPVLSKAAGLYMICTLSKHAAEAKGYDDALMLDYRGYLAEATGANLFLAIDGKLHTPTPDCFLDGITRRTVIELAKARGIEVIDRHIKPEELTKADEVFITGTAVEVTPVREIDDLSFEVGPITRQLIQDFDALTQDALTQDALTREPAQQAS